MVEGLRSWCIISLPPRYTLCLFHAMSHLRCRLRADNDHILDAAFCHALPHRTYCTIHPRQRTNARLNTRLESANIPPMRNLASDLSDGVRLCQLMVRASRISYLPQAPAAPSRRRRSQRPC